MFHVNCFFFQTALKFTSKKTYFSIISFHLTNLCSLIIYIYDSDEIKKLRKVKKILRIQNSSIDTFHTSYQNFIQAYHAQSLVTIKSSHRYFILRLIGMQMVAGKSQNRPRFPFDMQMSHQASPPSFFSIKLFQSARHEKQSVITGNVKYLFPEIQRSKFNFTIARVAPRISRRIKLVSRCSKNTLCAHTLYQRISFATYRYVQLFLLIFFHLRNA